MTSLNVKIGTCEQDDGTGTSNSSWLKNGRQCVHYRFNTNIENVSQKYANVFSLCVLFKVCNNSNKDLETCLINL